MLQVSWNSLIPFSRPPPPLSVWAATDISEELRTESRFGSETGSRTVSPAISSSSVSIDLL